MFSVTVAHFGDNAVQCSRASTIPQFFHSGLHVRVSTISLHRKSQQQRSDTTLSTAELFWEECHGPPVSTSSTLPLIAFWESTTCEFESRSTKMLNKSLESFETRPQCSPIHEQSISLSNDTSTFPEQFKNKLDDKESCGGKNSGHDNSEL